METQAIKKFENMNGKKIMSCGLFVDENTSYFAATPVIQFIIKFYFIKNIYTYLLHFNILFYFQMD